MRARPKLIALALLAVAAIARAEPLFELEKDGKTFLYRARPGDHPGRVAEMFGIPPEGMPALLKANGISDATQVGSGFVYRIPNEAARALSTQLDELRGERDRLAADAAAATQRAETVAAEARADREAATAATARAERSQRLERLWPFMQIALVLLAVVTAAAVLIARSAAGRQHQAERYARTLATELEERRKASMTERQESARKALDLEQRIRNLELQVTTRRPATTTTTTRAT